MADVTQGDLEFVANWNSECRHCSEYDGDFAADFVQDLATYRTQAEADTIAQVVKWLRNLHWTHTHKTSADFFATASKTETGAMHDVTQADRDIAADYYVSAGGAPTIARAIRAGERDNWFRVTRFTDHRAHHCAEAANRIRQLEAQLATAREAVGNVISHFQRSALSGDAPGHDHAISGIWDSDNGEKAGTECEWCKQWTAARQALDELDKPNG